MSLAYAREKIKARRKSSLKKNISHEMLDTTCEPLQFIEFWGDGVNSIDEDEFTEDAIYSEDDDINEIEKNKNSNQVYSDEQGFKYFINRIKDKIRYIYYFF